MIGYHLDSSNWNLLAVKQPAWFVPFLRLGTAEGFKMTEKMNDAQQSTLVREAQFSIEV